MYSSKISTFYQPKTDQLSKGILQVAAYLIIQCLLYLNLLNKQFVYCLITFSLILAQYFEDYLIKNLKFHLFFQKKNTKKHIIVHNYMHICINTKKDKDLV